MDQKFYFATDIHNLKKVKNYETTIGNTKIISNWKIIAHSDGDLILHSISSCLLSALNNTQTLGELFPDSDLNIKGIKSISIINQILKYTYNKFKINQIDLTIVCDQILLSKYLKEITNNLKLVLNNYLTTDAEISIKATRFEKKSKQIQVYCLLGVMK